MAVDAIIISDSGEDSFSGTNPLRLKIDGRIASIQTVLNYLEHQGQIVLPIKGDGTMCWSSAPKLNGIYLLSYLKNHKFNVALVNSYYEERNSFLSLLQHNPRSVIISTTFIHTKQALHKLVDDIRSLAPDIFIIVGGPFIYLSYLILQRSHEKHYETEAAKDDFLFLNNNNEPSVDLYIVSLRGEQILCEVLGKIKKNRPIDNLPNSARLTGKTYSFTRPIDDISTGKGIFVDWKLLPDAIFKSGVASMQASNGCPYKCTFCNFTKDRRLMFVKPIDELVAELKYVSSRGIRYVWFTDDNFRLGRGNLKSVCQRFVDEGIQIYWMSFIRASTLEDIDGELLRRSGCIEVQLGLESADSQILANMNKKANPKLYAEVVRKLLSVGINCSCYFLFGFPGETDETVLRTREFIKSIEYPELEGIFSWSMFPFILSPMSPIYEIEMRENYGLTGYMQNWAHKTMDYRQAVEHIKNAFFELENSAPIYRGDNLDILFGLKPYQRKKFLANRHRFSKLAAKSHLEKLDIINSFTEALA